MDNSSIVTRGIIALGLGLIIGLQRERKESVSAGIRTFPLFALIGFFCTLLSQAGQPWMVPAGLISLALILFRTVNQSSGVTTEMAALLIFLIGAYLAGGQRLDLAIVTGGVCALLLHLKERMHTWVERMNVFEVRALMQFVLIALVILPVLPDETYDNFKVLNPRQIWLMVVLITGISLVSFSVQKVLGPRQGSFWAGVLGGLISSTATTVTLARLSGKMKSGIFLAAGIIIASTTAFVRILSEVVIVAPHSFTSIAAPLSILFIFMVGQSIFTFWRAPPAETHDLSSENPSQLKAAVVFGLLYAAILFGSAWARHHFGDQGLYFVSILSGLIDVDAITISTSKLLEERMISTDLGWRSILLAFLSNLAFKTGLVWAFAGATLKKQVGIHFCLAILVGCLILAFYRS